MNEVDVWLLSFDERSDVDPVEGLVRLFGVDAAKAEELIRHLPRIVKRRVKTPMGQRFVAALETIGAKAVLRPSRTSSQPPRPSAPPGAGPAYSLPPMAVRPAEFGEVAPEHGSAANDLVDPRDKEKASEPPRASVVDSPAEMAFSSPDEIRGGDFVPAVSAAPVRTPRYSSAPPAAVSSRPPVKLPSVPPLSVNNPLRLAAPSIMLILSGAILAGVMVVFGHSVFLGTGKFHNYITDGLAMMMVFVGLRQLYRVFAVDDDPSPSLRVMGLVFLFTLTLAVALDIGLSETDALAPRTAEDVNGKLHDEFEAGRAVDEVLGDRSIAFPGYEHEDVHRLVNAIEGLALRPRFCEPIQVSDVPTVRCMIVELTDSPESREALSAAYRRFLGMRAHRMEAGLLIADPSHEYMRLQTYWNGR